MRSNWDEEVAVEMEELRELRVAHKDLRQQQTETKAALDKANTRLELMKSQVRAGGYCTTGTGLGYTCVVPCAWPPYGAMDGAHEEPGGAPRFLGFHTSAPYRMLRAPCGWSSWRAGWGLGATGNNGGYSVPCASLKTLGHTCTGPYVCGTLWQIIVKCQGE